MEYNEIDKLFEKHAIPFEEIRRVAGLLPYGTSLSVMFKMLAITGCRVKELGSFRKSLVYKHAAHEGWAVAYWRCGKNQLGYRSEVLPHALVEEIDYYRHHNNVPEDQLFALNPSTFERYFRFFRCRLGGRWLESMELPHDGGTVRHANYYTLGGLRKSFVTLVFAKEMRKWKSAEVALVMTSRRLHHSCQKLTCDHYLREYEALGIERFIDREIWEIYDFPCQTRLSHDWVQPLHETPLCAFD